MRLSIKAIAHGFKRRITIIHIQELPAEVQVEEELVPGYQAIGYYPVKLWEVLNIRYQVIAKLGCGVRSVGVEHPGFHYMRLMIDSFTVQGPHGSHHCLLFNPLSMTLTDLRKLTPDKILNECHFQ